EQVERSMVHVERKITPLERYIYMTGLLDRGETLFYRTLIDHISELMPIIYTPTVGEACQRWGEIFRRQRGLYVTAQDRGRVREVLSNWPEADVEVVVATDGERILGLGDLGAQGMGIPIGKLALYTACAGIDPAHCLPVTIDVGTENLELRQSPYYPGLDQARVRGEEYRELIAEFADAVREIFPHAMLQWEDFATDNAFEILAAHRDRIRSFNDDIQGAAGVTLAGLYAASRAPGRPLPAQKLLFFGAGSAATGSGNLLVPAMVVGHGDRQPGGVGQGGRRDPRARGQAALLVLRLEGPGHLRPRGPAGLQGAVRTPACADHQPDGCGANPATHRADRRGGAAQGV